MAGKVGWYLLTAATFFYTQKNTYLKSDTQTNWGKKEGLSPVLSSTFAFSGSEVFTINVRLLSVNTSINTAQCFTSYASFWLSHLFKESSRERKGDGERGEEEERCMWVHGAAALRPLVASSAKQLWHQLMKLQQLLQGVEVIIATKKKRASTVTETAVRHLGPRHNHRFLLLPEIRD